MQLSFEGLQWKHRSTPVMHGVAFMSAQNQCSDPSTNELLAPELQRQCIISLKRVKTTSLDSEFEADVMLLRRPVH